MPGRNPYNSSSVCYLRNVVHDYSGVSELDHWTQLTAASPNDSVTLMVSSPQWSFVDGYRRVVSVNGRCVSVTATCYRLIELGVKIRNRRCLLLYM